MAEQDALIARRLGLIRGTHLLIGAAVTMAIGRPGIADAAKADKRDFFYQDKPKDGKSCSTCRLYSPIEGGKGQCAIVDGDVSPNGWCLAYSARA